MNKNPYQQELESRLARRGSTTDDVSETIEEVDRIIEQHAGGGRDKLKDILRDARQGSKTKISEVIKHAGANTDLQEFIRGEIKRIDDWHDRGRL